MQTVNYKNNQNDGKCRMFPKEGELLFDTLYKNGKFISAISKKSGTENNIGPKLILM